MPTLAQAPRRADGHGRRRAGRDDDREDPLLGRDGYADGCEPMRTEYRAPGRISNAPVAIRSVAPRGVSRSAPGPSAE